MKKYILFIVIVLNFTQGIWAAVTPVSKCSEAYNHLLKNPYENQKYKAPKKKSSVKEVEEELVVFEKEISREEFEQKLEQVSLAISTLNPYFSSGYDAIILSEIKDSTHLLLNKFLTLGWDPITQLEVEKLSENLSKTDIFMRRLNLTP